MPARRYRQAKPLLFELREHCGIYFEEELYNQALNLLLSLLTAGTATSTPAFVPTPQHLSLAATLVVHPSLTTRAKSAERIQAANTALRLLRLTNTLLGPISADFNSAFTFTHFSSSRHGGRRKTDENSAEGGDTEPLNNELAQAGSLWARAEDFWQIVGWAFNCSIQHLKRWERWQIWLEFVCEVLEDDWVERKRRGEEIKSGSDLAEEEVEHLLLESLIFKYIDKASGGSGRNRRILRAIFADGSSSSLNEFREIFKNEPKELAVDRDKPRKREVDVNIEEEEYGDWMAKDEDSEEETEIKTRKRRSRVPSGMKPEMDTSEDTQSDGSEGASTLGGIHSLALRQRLLQLLSTVSASLPNHFTTLEDLYTLFVEFVKPLPLSTFQLLVTPSVLPHFEPAALTSLCEMILFRLVNADEPDSQTLLSDQSKLETSYLPYAANTSSIVDNAKVSALNESLLRLLATSKRLKPSPALKEAVETGILAREEKAQGDARRGRGTKKKEEIEWKWLVESGERMRSLTGTLLENGD